MKVILEELNIRKNSQVETWLRWYQKGELQRLEQPVKGVEYSSEVEKLQA